MSEEKKEESKVPQADPQTKADTAPKAPEAPKSDAAPKADAAPAPSAAPATDAAAAPAAAKGTDEGAKEKPKKEKPSNCAGCNKSIKKKRWYYKNGKFYCTKRCWSTAAKKAAKKEEAPAAS